MATENPEHEGFEAQPDPDHTHRSHSETGTWERKCENMASEAESRMRQMKQQFEDATMTLLPASVTKHLVESHKEFVRAGQRVGDILLEKLDEKARRAEEIHARKDDA